MIDYGRKTGRSRDSSIQNEIWLISSNVVKKGDYAGNDIPA